MRRLAIIFIILFVATSLRAQNRALDSLNLLIAKERTDTTRVKFNIEKIKLLGEVNLDSADALATKTIAEAKRINFREGLANAYLQLAGNASRQGDYAVAENSLHEAGKIVKTIPDSSYTSSLYAAYGMMYGIRGVYDTSSEYYLKAITIDESMNRLNALGNEYGNLAIGYQMQSNFVQALKYQQKSLTLAEKQHNISGQAYTLMNIGNTYLGMGDTIRCEQAIQKAIQYARSIGIKNVELYGYTNLASMYTDMGKWQQVYDNGIKAADLAKGMGDAPIQASSMSKAAVALANMGRKAEAELLNRQAIGIADSTGQPMNIGQAYASMGQLLRLEKKYSESIPYYLKALPLLSQTEPYTAGTAGNYFEMSDSYEKIGQFENALSNFKKASKISDSVHSKDNVRKATEMSLTYEFDKKQTVAKAIQDKQNAEAATKQYLLIAGLVLMVAVAVLAWIAYRNKQKANDLLSEQKTEIESALAQLKETQAQLVQSEKMASLGELTAGIAHEIQNPLNFVNNFSEVNTELIAEMGAAIDAGNLKEARELANDISENEQKINHHGKRADAIVKGMLQHSRTGTKEPTDVNALADEYLRLAYHGLRAKDKSFNATLKTDYDASLSSAVSAGAKVSLVPQDIGRVILNLITNAFYAVREKKLAAGSDYDPTVTVTTTRINNPGHPAMVSVTVTDNGNGIPPQLHEKIFQPFFTTKPAGQGTGLGLSMSYDIVSKEHGGTLHVESQEGAGTSFIIQIPI